MRQRWPQGISAKVSTARFFETEVDAIHRRRSWAEIALLLAFTVLPGADASEVSIPGRFATPGTSVLLPAVFTPGASFVSGIQLDLHYDRSAMSLDATAGDAARSVGKTLYSADLDPNTRRFLIMGPNQYAIPGGDLIVLSVNVNPNASAGVYPLVLSTVVGADQSGQEVSTTATSGTLTIQGTSSPSLRLQATGVLNGASLLPGPVAAGELVTLFGSAIGPASPQFPQPYPSRTALAGTSVLFDGVPAPIFYAAPNQINAVVPYGVSGRATTQLQVTNDRHVIAELSLPIAPAVPAIFTLDASGVGAGAILNQDLTVNSPSNPATRGSVAVLFATGAGQTDPPGVDGELSKDLSRKPTLATSVQIGRVEAEILYIGPAPGLISGVLQINCTVPLNTPPGNGVPVVLRVGAARSQLGVTMAVN